MARDDYGRGDPSWGAWPRREQQDPRWEQRRWSASGPEHLGYGGNVSGYGRGGALDLGYGGFDVGGRDSDWGIGSARAPGARPGNWPSDDSGRGQWQGAWRSDDRVDRSERRGYADRGNETGPDRGPMRRDDDPHGWADENLYGGRQALKQPEPYHGGYQTMERLGREGEVGGGGSFSTEGFNAGGESPQWEHRAAAMHGSASLIGYSESGLGRPYYGGEATRPSYAGLGPRGYRRSDERIREDVCEALTHHPEIDASDIDVTVENGEVSLSGSVDDRRTRRLAEDVAERCAGVHDVHNRLRVDLSAGRSAERAEGGSRRSRSADDDDSPYRSA